jgi:hypothetical protein
MQDHLRELGASGRLAAGVSVAELATLYEDIVAFRERWGHHVDDHAEERGLVSLLGSRPHNSLARRQWDVLARRALNVGDSKQRERARER